MRAVKIFLIAKFILFPVVLAGFAAAWGYPSIGTLISCLVTILGWVWFRRSGYDTIVFPILLGSLGLFWLVMWGASILNWVEISTHPVAVLDVCIGLGMGGSVIVRRPWSMSVSSGAWHGMKHDPLFRRINAVISSYWAVAFCLFGLRSFLAWPYVVQWCLLGLGLVISTVLPGIWVWYDLKKRIAAHRGADWHGGDFHIAKTETDADADVIVVGAGLGGLTAGALLAQSGLRVIVCEQHRIPGGFAQTWNRHAVKESGRPRFRFSGGVHDVSGLWETDTACGPVTGVLRKLGLEKHIKWLPMHHADVIDGHRNDIPSDWSAYTESLCCEFPEDAPGIRAVLDAIRTIFFSMYSLGSTRCGVPDMPATVKELIRFARQHPLAVQWMERPFMELLQHHTANRAVQRALSRFTTYITDRSETLKVADMVPIFGYLLHGGFSPEGGSGQLVDILVHSIRQHGGQIRLGTEVSAVGVATPSGTTHPRITGVTLSTGAIVRAPAIVMNADYLCAMKKLLPAFCVPLALKNQVAVAVPACSAFIVHLGLRGSCPVLPPLLRVGKGSDVVLVSLSSRIDPTAASPGYWTMEITRLLSQSEARTWFPEANENLKKWRKSAAYRQRKKTFADAMIALVATAIPEVLSHTVLQEEASPVTFHRYGFSSNGSVYGCLGSTQRHHSKSPIAGLVFAGSVTHGPGVEAVMISGALAAEALVPGLLQDTPVS